MSKYWNLHKKEYLETLDRRGEIEFNYNNHHYHIESTDYRGDDFDIWKFSRSDSNDGKKIAHCKNKEVVLTAKAFNGKSLEEIDDEITDCYLL